MVVIKDIVHQLTLKQFLFDNGDGPPMADGIFSDVEQRNMIEATKRVIQEDADYAFVRRVPSEIPGFSIAHILDTVIVWEDATNEVVGGMGYGVPYVYPEFRNRKLGREIYRVAFDSRIKNMSHTSAVFTDLGLATRKSFHRYAVETALKNGYDVPEKVLKDYPDLYREIKIERMEEENA